MFIIIIVNQIFVSVISLSSGYDFNSCQAFPRKDGLFATVNIVTSTYFSVIASQ